MRVLLLVCRHGVGSVRAERDVSPCIEPTIVIITMGQASSMAQNPAVPAATSRATCALPEAASLITRLM